MASVEVELMEMFEWAKKAAEAAVKTGGPAEAERCVEALGRLRELTVTVDSLVKTQVGKKLRFHLTKHPIKNIQKAACELRDHWKKKIIEETAKNKNVDNFTLRNSGATNVGVPKSKPNISSNQMKIENKDSRVNAKNFKQEKPISTSITPTSPPFTPPKKSLSMFKCSDNARQKTREIFVEALSKVALEANEDVKREVETCDPVSVAISLESVMFEKLGRLDGTNKIKHRSILFNLKDQNNPDFRRRVLLGEIKPENVVNMTTEEMASDDRKLRNVEIKKKAMIECERASAPKATTDQFKCGRCGQRKCTYSQMQTRSADEPMTTYVTCVNCSKRWKFC